MDRETWNRPHWRWWCRVLSTNPSDGRPEDQSGLHRVCKASLRIASHLASETVAWGFMTTALSIDVFYASGHGWYCSFGFGIVCEGAREAVALRSPGAKKGAHIVRLGAKSWWLNQSTKICP